MKALRLPSIVMISLLSSLVVCAEQTADPLPTSLAAAIDEHRHSCFVRPLGNNRVGLVYRQRLSDEEDALAYRICDENGSIQKQLDIHSIGDDLRIWDPTFVVSPGGDVHVFWHTIVRQNLFAAVVNANGELVSGPERVESVNVGGPFLAACTADKIVGIASGPISLSAGQRPSCVYVAMDLKHRVLTKIKPMRGFSAHRGDDVAADENGRLHWAYIDLFGEQDKLEQIISYKVFDAKGDVEEEQGVAQMAMVAYDDQALAITLDETGAAHIYYAHVTRYPDKGRSGATKLEHFKVKAKTPAKGNRAAVSLAVPGCDLQLVNSQGETSTIKRLRDK